LKSWRFLISSGFDGQLLTLLTSGTSPASSAALITLEFLSMGLIRFISIFYRAWYIHLVNKVKKQRERGEIRQIGTTATGKLKAEEKQQ